MDEEKMLNAMRAIEDAAHDIRRLVDTLGLDEQTKRQFWDALAIIFFQWDEVTDELDKV